MMHCFIWFKVTTVMSSYPTALAVIWIHIFYSIYLNKCCTVIAELTAIIELAVGNIC